MILNDLIKKRLIDPPKFIVSNSQFIVTMGSRAYGTHSEDSDFDCYGWAIPLKEDAFPHLNGHIHDFDVIPEKKDPWIKQHILDPDNKREYDIQIFTVAKYFRLLMENNPNMLDSLFVRQESILHITNIGQMVRDKRSIFPTKELYKKFRGYLNSQIGKIKKIDGSELIEVKQFEKTHGIPESNTFQDILQEFEIRKAKRKKKKVGFVQGLVNYFSKKEDEESLTPPNPLSSLKDNELQKYRNLYVQMMNSGNRNEDRKIHGGSLKFATHALRLSYECEQLLLTGDVDLMANKEELSAMKKGAYTIDQIQETIVNRDPILQNAYANTKLPNERENKAKVKSLLLNVYEEHYGNLSNVVAIPDLHKTLVDDIKKLIDERIKF